MNDDTPAGGAPGGAADLPAPLQAQLKRTMSSLPRDWLIKAVRPLGRDWVIDLADTSGAVISQIVLHTPRSEDESHAAQPRTTPRPPPTG